MQPGDTSMADCCDHNRSDTPDGCDPLSHCGACVAAAVFIDVTTTNVMISTTGQQFLTVAAPLHVRTHSPPFRPPIG